jgi:hypothetical protein
MDRDEALRLLTGGPDGVAEWNKRRESGETIPDLHEADLGWANLSEANLFGANLSEANLNTANLRGADLNRANLSEAYLSGANLSEASLYWADLGGANLGGANLSGANLGLADLSEANLGWANLGGAKFSGANLSGADLSGANLSGANLFGAHLNGANLNLADLTRADFRLYEPRSIKQLIPLVSPCVRFDGNRIAEARFGSWFWEPWSILRRTYTGSKLLFFVFFTMAALLPLIGHVLFWTTVNKVELRFFPLGVGLIKRAASVMRQQNAPNLVQWVERADQFLAIVEPQPKISKPAAVASTASTHNLKLMIELLNDGLIALKSLEHTPRPPVDPAELADLRYWIEQTLRIIQPIVPKGQVPLKERKVWQLLLGTDRGFWQVLLTIALLLYNVLRAALTYYVGVLRDEEDRTITTPEWPEYRILWFSHQLLAVLLVVATVSGLYQLLTALSTPVLVAG